MDPILGYELVQTGIQVLVKQLVNEIEAERKMQEQLELLAEKQRLDIETARINREMSFKFERQTLEIQFQNNLILKEQELRNHLTEWSIKEDFKLCWPLTNTYQNSSLVAKPNSKNARPVMIFITEPNVVDKQSLLMKQVNMLLKRYFAHPLFRATTENALTWQSGAWKPGFNQNNHINNLFEWLKLQPCVVVNPVFMGNEIDIYINSWGPFYEGNAPIDELCTTLNITDNENETKEKITYTIALLTGFYTDIYHLLETGAQPQMPVVLKDFCTQNNFKYKIPQNIIDSYRAALYGITCSNCLGEKLPDTYLNVAKSLRSIGSDYAVKTSEQLVREGIGIWANQKSGIKALPQNDNECMELIKNKANKYDAEFVENVKRWYGDKIPKAINQIVLQSPGIEKWTETSNKPFKNWICSIAYGKGIFVAIGYKEIKYSADGKVWIGATNELNELFLKAIVYGNEKFVAVGELSGYNNGTERGKIAFSLDGKNWSEVTKDFFERPFLSAIFADGKFVVGSLAKGHMAYSSDGNNWTKISDSSAFDIVGIAYGNGKFVAACHYRKLLHSTNGKNWKELTDSIISNIHTIVYGNGIFVAGGRDEGYGKMAYSIDGKIWTEITNHPFRYGYINIIAYGGGIFVAGGDEEDYGKMAYSIDGKIWMEITSHPFKKGIKAIAYGNGKFVAGDNNGQMAYSGKI